MSLQRIPLVYITGKKSLEMLNFKNLSPSADFYSKLDSDLHIVNKNVLYITHEVDKIKKIVTKLENSLNLQTQVDDFYEEVPRTSPQTESKEQ